MKALVTGSSGHLGEALVRTLRAAGQEVVGLDIMPSPFTDVVASISDRDAVKACMRDTAAIYHTATLHKPHVVTHGKSEFVETNVAGTLVLLEAALEAGAGPFIFTSTTSVFGDALRPPADQPAAWITEDVVPVPKNIYGVTKLAAEDLCRLFHRNHGLDCLVLRTSRFFPEEDDDREKRRTWSAENTKANELLYRRADIADMVSAHLAAARRAPDIGFGRYIVSASSPFLPDELADLRSDAPGVLRRHFPEFERVYARLGWRMFEGIDRVYVNDAARRDLGWEPEFGFERLLRHLDAGQDPRSELAILIGSKGYHDEVFEDGPFPVD